MQTVSAHFIFCITYSTFSLAVQFSEFSLSKCPCSSCLLLESLGSCSRSPGGSRRGGRRTRRERRLNLQGLRLLLASTSSGWASRFLRLRLCHLALYPGVVHLVEEEVGERELDKVAGGLPRPAVLDRRERDDARGTEGDAAHRRVSREKAVRLKQSRNGMIRVAILRATDEGFQREKRFQFNLILDSETTETSRFDSMHYLIQYKTVSTVIDRLLLSKKMANFQRGCSPG